jgi:hypothetical protein
MGFWEGDGECAGPGALRVTCTDAPAGRSRGGHIWLPRSGPPTPTLGVLPPPADADDGSTFIDGAAKAAKSSQAAGDKPADKTAASSTPK